MSLKFFTKNVEQRAKEQCELIQKTNTFKNAKIRIMPDVHAGKGCVIGFTATNFKNVIPEIVGVDVGCGVRVVCLGKQEIDFEKLDNVIHKNIPSGRSIHQKAIKDFNLDDLITSLTPQSRSRIKQSLGTLGGGNHFIEIDEDDKGNKYLLIHTGSRKLGTDICQYYRDKMADRLHLSDEAKKTQELIELDEELTTEYLHDMKIAQEYAAANRQCIAEQIIQAMDWCIQYEFESVHNYIDLEHSIIRKGAISAQKGELCVIPLNMRDGSIIGIGKGNEDWNYSAPHGAGRIMSRKKAKENISLEDFQKAMNGIYSTSICKKTLDESPFVYKEPKDIISPIQETVEIQTIIKPIYNFKARN